MVALLNTSGSHFCGGSIIKPNIVVTAAHCLRGRGPADIVVQAGILHLNNPPWYSQLRHADLRLRIYSLYQFLYYHLRSVRVRLISLTILRSCSAAEHPKRTRGDSGGPAVEKESGPSILVGVVSFGHRCAEAPAYGVYTNVPVFTEWIAENILKLQS
ncbi:trypsin-1-like [Ixodes scapularis]